MLLVGSGRRPQKLPGGFKNKKLHQEIKKQIRAIVKEKDPDRIISGMALGLDQWLAEIAVELGVPFVAALPFEGQENRWPPKSQEHYCYLLSKSTKVVHVDREPGYISDQVAPGVYHPYKMLRRDEWMIDQLKEGDVLLTLWDEERTGGTYHTICYAKRTCHGVLHHNVNPTTKRVIIFGDRDRIYNESISSIMNHPLYEEYEDVPF